MANKLAEANTYLEVLLGDLEAQLASSRRVLSRVKGGPGSGENEGHPFRGNQWTSGKVFSANDESVARIRTSITDLSKNPRLGQFSSYDGEWIAGVNADIADKIAPEIATAFDGLRISQDLDLGDTSNSMFDGHNIDTEANAVAIAAAAYAGFVSSIARSLEPVDGRYAVTSRSALMIRSFCSEIVGDPTLYDPIKNAINSVIGGADGWLVTPIGIMKIADAINSLVDFSKFSRVVESEMAALSDANIIHMTGSLNALESMIDGGISSHVELSERLSAAASSLDDVIYDLRTKSEQLKTQARNIENELWNLDLSTQLASFEVWARSTSVPDMIAKDSRLQELNSSIEELEKEIKTATDKSSSIETILGGMHTYDADKAAGLDRFVFSSFEHTEASGYGVHGIVLNPSVVSNPQTWATVNDISDWGGQHGGQYVKQAASYRSSIVNDGGLKMLSVIARMALDWRASSDLYEPIPKPGLSHIEVKMKHVTPESMQAIIVSNPPRDKETADRIKSKFRGDVIRQEIVSNSHGGVTRKYYIDDVVLYDSTWADAKTGDTEMTTQVVREYRKWKRAQIMARSFFPDAKVLIDEGANVGGVTVWGSPHTSKEKSIKHATVELECLLADILEYLESLGVKSKTKGGPGSGERDGHPFRGNQYTNGASSGAEPVVFRVDKYTEARLANIVKSVYNRTSSVVNHFADLLPPAVLSKFRMMAEDAAVRIANLVDGKSISMPLGPMDHILAPHNGIQSSTEGAIFSSSASIHPDLNAIGILATSYAELALVALGNRSGRFIEFLEDIGVARAKEFNGRNLQEILSPEQFFEICQKRAEAGADTEFVHMTRTLSSVLSMVSNGINSHRTLSKMIDESLSKLKSEFDRLSAVGDMDSALEVSKKIDSILTAMDEGGGNTYKADKDSGLDRFVFMSREHSEADLYGDFGVLVDGSLRSEEMTWATATDITAINAQSSNTVDINRESYDGDTIESYRRSIVNDGGIDLIASAREISGEALRVYRTENPSFEDDDDWYSHIEVKSSRIPPGKISAVIVHNKKAFKAVRDAGFSGDVIWADGNDFVLNDGEVILASLSGYKKTSTSVTTEAIREYRNYKRANRNKKYFKESLIVKGGPGSGERDGHPFRGNQWTGVARGSDADAVMGSLPSKHEEAVASRLVNINDSVRKMNSVPSITRTVFGIEYSIPDMDKLEDEASRAIVAAIEMSPIKFTIGDSTFSATKDVKRHLFGSPSDPRVDGEVDVILEMFGGKGLAALRRDLVNGMISATTVAAKDEYRSRLYSLETEIASAITMKAVACRALAASRIIGESPKGLVDWMVDSGWKISIKETSGDKFTIDGVEFIAGGQASYRKNELEVFSSGPGAMIYDSDYYNAMGSMAVLAHEIGHSAYQLLNVRKAWLYQQIYENNKEAWNYGLIRRDGPPLKVRPENPGDSQPISIDAERASENHKKISDAMSIFATEVEKFSPTEYSDAWRKSRDGATLYDSYRVEGFKIDSHRWSDSIDAYSGTLRHNEAFAEYMKLVTRAGHGGQSPERWASIFKKDKPELAKATDAFMVLFNELRFKRKGTPKVIKVTSFRISASKGGPGSGDKLNHPFRGNQWTTSSRMDIETELSDADISEIFGKKKMSLESLYRAVGAYDGAKVSISKIYGGGGVEIEMEDESIGLMARRRLFVARDGKLVMSNEYITLGRPGTGIGSDVFYRQVMECSRLGVSKIIASCVGDANDASYSGYYTWARLGYMNTEPVVAWAKLTDVPHSIRKFAKYDDDDDSGLVEFDSISDVMSTMEGREFWKRHGSGFDGEFSLKKGSRSMRILDAYMKSKSKPA